MEKRIKSVRSGKTCLALISNIAIISSFKMYLKKIGEKEWDEG